MNIWIDQVSNEHQMSMSQMVWAWDIGKGNCMNIARGVHDQ